MAFVRYVIAVYDRELRELSYRMYVTDALNNIPQMKYFSVSWMDTIKSTEEQDNRTADEVVDDVIASLSGG